MEIKHTGLLITEKKKINIKININITFRKGYNNLFSNQKYKLFERVDKCTLNMPSFTIKI